MASEECQPDEIRVFQDGLLWRVAHHNEFADGFRRVDDAIAHALRIFRERRHQRRHIVVLPATNPLMWD